MYHSILHFVIMCNDCLLIQMLGELKPLERFQHEILICETDATAMGPIPGDVIFCDAASWPFLQRQGYGKNARLILCADRQEVGALTDHDLGTVSEVWEIPLDKRTTSLRLSRLQESIRRDKEWKLSQTYLDAVIDTLPDMVWFKSREGLHLKVNRAFCQTVGKTRNDVTGRDHCYIWNVSREEFERGEFVCKDTDERVLRTGELCQSDEKVKSQNGMRQFKTYKAPLYDEDGTIMGTVGIGHDVTDLENMSAEMEILLRSMPYAILVRNDLDRIINVNPIFVRCFGITKEQILGIDYKRWIKTAFESGGAVNSEGYVEARVCQSGRTVEIHEEPIHDVFQNEVGGLSIYRDVTVEKELEEQILRNSNTDFMTGLYNRRCFYQYISKNRNNQPVSLLYVDLDNFKKVNDSYGHRAGDNALIETAKLLQAEFTDQFIARFGGDEFLIAILGPCELSQLKCRAEQLLIRMQDDFNQFQEYRMLSASIGIAQTTDPNLDIDTLIQQSDAALYEAKQHGRARCFIYLDK